MYTHTILKNMLRAETVDIEDVSVAPEVIPNLAGTVCVFTCEFCCVCPREVILAF